MFSWPCHRVTLHLPGFFCFSAGIPHTPSKQLLLHVGFCIIGLCLSKAGLSRDKKQSSRGMSEGKPGSPWRQILGSSGCAWPAACLDSGQSKGRWCTPVVPHPSLNPTYKLKLEASVYVPSFFTCSRVKKGKEQASCYLCSELRFPFCCSLRACMGWVLTGPGWDLSSLSSLHEPGVCQTSEGPWLKPQTPC